MLSCWGQSQLPWWCGEGGVWFAIFRWVRGWLARQKVSLWDKVIVPCYPAYPSVFLRIWQMMEPKQRQYIWQSKERRFIFLKYDSQPEATEELLMWIMSQSMWPETWRRTEREDFGPQCKISESRLEWGKGWGEEAGWAAHTNLSDDWSWVFVPAALFK